VTGAGDTCSHAALALAQGELEERRCSNQAAASSSAKLGTAAVSPRSCVALSGRREEHTGFRRRDRAPRRRQVLGTVSVEAAAQPAISRLEALAAEGVAAFESELRKAVQIASAAPARGYVGRSCPRRSAAGSNDEGGARLRRGVAQTRKARLPAKSTSLLKGLPASTAARAAAPPMPSCRGPQDPFSPLAELDRSRSARQASRERHARADRIAEQLAEGMAERAAAGSKKARRRIAERMRELVTGRSTRPALAGSRLQAEKDDVTEEIVR